MTATNLWRPCGRIRLSAPALLAHAQTGALAVVLVASYGSSHLSTKSFAAPPRPPSNR